MPTWDKGDFDLPATIGHRRIKSRRTHARACGNFEKHLSGCRLQESYQWKPLTCAKFCSLLRPQIKTTELKMPHARVRCGSGLGTHPSKRSGRDPLGGYSCGPRPTSTNCELLVSNEISTRVHMDHL